ncbi:MAG: hypothetical protein IAF02_00330, partial [Anaerolineae bacterium]|nr:hypothetical protein [Anaerolineae bacterium]
VVIAQVAKLGKEEEYQDALDITDGALRQLTGLGTDAWLSMETDDILANLSMREDLGGVETAVFMAGIFYQEGELHALQDDDDSADFRFLKAMQLQLAILNTHPDMPMPEVVPSVPVMQARLAENDVLLPEETNQALIIYYETTGAFSAAEDVLYEWIDSEPGSSEALEAGIAFYQALLLKSDDELEAGGLPRDEVDEGLADLLQELD